jgi:hypothetical protein
VANSWQTRLTSGKQLANKVNKWQTAGKQGYQVANSWQTMFISGKQLANNVYKWQTAGKQG